MRPTIGRSDDVGQRPPVGDNGAVPEPKPHWTQRRGVSTVVTLIIIIAAVGVVMVARQSPGRPQPTIFPGQIRQLTPGDGDQVPNQSRVGVSVAPGWVATLSIDGTQIPTDEMTIRESLGEYFFDPAPGKVFESLRPGQVCVTASARSQVDDVEPVTYTWCFTAI